MRATHVGGAPAHQVVVRLRRVGEAAAVDREQLGVHERIEQWLELLGADADRLGQRRRGHRSILERGEKVELHAGQHRHRRVDGVHVAEDRGLLDLGLALP